MCIIMLSVTVGSISLRFNIKAYSLMFLYKRYAVILAFSLKPIQSLGDEIFFFEKIYLITLYFSFLIPFGNLPIILFVQFTET